jgi:hypothetical protein
MHESVVAQYILERSATARSLLGRGKTGGAIAQGVLVLMPSKDRKTVQVSRAVFRRCR